MGTYTDTTIGRIAPPGGPEGREIPESEWSMEDYTKHGGWISPTWRDIQEVLQGLGCAQRVTDHLQETPPRIRIDVRDGLVEQVKRLLARHGGTPSGPWILPSYQFASLADRSLALDAVRSRHGWTSVEPV